MIQPPERNRAGNNLGRPDTTAELWDRIADDLSQHGRICAETVENLVDEACRRPTDADDEPGQAR